MLHIVVFSVFAFFHDAHLEHEVFVFFGLFVTIAELVQVEILQVGEASRHSNLLSAAATADTVAGDASAASAVVR